MSVRLPRQAPPRPTTRFIGADQSRAADIARMIDHYHSRATAAVRIVSCNHSRAVARTGRG